MSDENEVLDNELDGDEDIAESKSKSGDAAPSQDEESNEPESKRINDLTSKWQKEQARAEKAEKALAALKGGNPSTPQSGNASDTSADADEFVNFAREQSRETLFKSDPRLAEAGMSADDIAGNTLSEMKASFAKQVKLVSGFESRLRSRVLREHGLDADLGGTSASEKTPDFARMTDKEFDAFMAERGTGRSY